MESTKALTRWEAKVSTKITKASADQIWPLVADFFNLHEWFPGLPTCYGIHGANGDLGCVRYCAGFSLSATNHDYPAVEGGPVKWSKEKLTVMDHARRSLTYEMVDCNVGLRSYVATMAVVVADDGDGCVLEWSFAVDPVEGWSLMDMVKRYEVGLQGMARKMEAAF
ncbi:hypothetical protein MLD38_006164 [Melastoma candidum]|uniref:Uncharacterized protein n=1 Tax=Melastoma candidum TaxID=119954 RepID=A0ACB9RVH3_9MYRT|nr:hypothetical protein MLD38_006164 [Melastoma candidum]